MRVFISKAGSVIWYDGGNRYVTCDMFTGDITGQMWSHDVDSEKAVKEGTAGYTEVDADHFAYSVKWIALNSEEEICCDDDMSVGHVCLHCGSSMVKP